jgi:hypothetical protein
VSGRPDNLEKHFGSVKVLRVLLDALAERERWLAFRDERVRAVAKAWLESHGLEATTRRLDER